MKAHFQMMAAYNAWANRRLCDAVAGLDEGDYRADYGVFFRSVHGTLNHLLVGDTLWLARFRRQARRPFALDTILHDDRAETTAARRVLDADIVRYVDDLTDGELADDLTYRMITQDVTMTQPLVEALAHFFNHQTHHRGQIHALLTRLTGDAPSFDLVQFQRENG